MKYFSESENGPRARIDETISPSVWGGIVATVQSLVSTGAFGEHFPAICPDGAAPIGTDEQTLELAIRAEIPDLEWPLQTTEKKYEGFFSNDVPYSPTPLVVLDFVQFCYMHAAKPIQRNYHSFYEHHHLSFDTEAGRNDFLSKINRIFSRNGISFELKEDGDVIRLAPPGLREELISADFDTGDSMLDKMLCEARSKFLNPDPSIRREAVERLWDSWED